MDHTSLLKIKPHGMVQHISKPVLRKCCNRECVMEDRISALPDDILVSIISHLKLREAARTSVLSHRWRFIWTLTNGVLDFVEYVDVPISDAGYTPSPEEENILNTARRKFLEWVNLVLCSHKASIIDEFRVCFNVGIGNSDAVDSWIKFALERHAKRLILDLGQKRCFETHAKYALRAQVFSNCNLSSLTTLHLKQISVTSEVFGYMLSCFPLLQVLHLHGISSLEELKITGPSPNLRCLVIKHCCSMRYLEAHVVNLLSFTYRGPKLTMYFKEVPCVVEANVNEVFLVKNSCQFSSCFSQLRSLTLHLPRICAQWRWYREGFPKLPEFKKLRWLKLSTTVFDVDCCLSHCIELLKASPSLQTFVLKMYTVGISDSDDIKVRRRPAIYQHKRLKVMKFIGFDGGAMSAELLQRLLANLPSLKEVVVDPRPLSPLDIGLWDIDKAIAAAHLLENLLPRKAKMVIASG